MKKKKVIIDAFKAAFPHTIPILAGFSFLGLSFGVLMNVSGFSFWYPLVMSIVVFGGSIEFVARHLFYGLSMLDKYKNVGIKKYYLIFGMCDETFSINCSADIPEGIDKGWFMTAVTLLDHIYWINGSLIGGLVGSLIPFDTTGLDFVMTAMFVVIFLEQWMKEKKHYTSLIGLFASIVCLLLFGSDSFMIPTMLLILFLLTALRKPIEKGGGLE